MGLSDEDLAGLPSIAIPVDGPLVPGPHDISDLYRGCYFSTYCDRCSPDCPDRRGFYVIVGSSAYDSGPMNPLATILAAVGLSFRSPHVLSPDMIVRGGAIAVGRHADGSPACQSFFSYINRFKRAFEMNLTILAESAPDPRNLWPLHDLEGRGRRWRNLVDFLRLFSDPQPSRIDIYNLYQFFELKDPSLRCKWSSMSLARFFAANCRSWADGMSPRIWIGSDGPVAITSHVASLKLNYSIGNDMIDILYSIKEWGFNVSISSRDWSPGTMLWTIWPLSVVHPDDDIEFRLDIGDT